MGRCLNPQYFFLHMQKFGFMNRNIKHLKQTKIYGKDLIRNFFVFYARAYICMKHYQDLAKQEFVLSLNCLVTAGQCKSCFALSEIAWREQEPLTAPVTQDSSNIKACVFSPLYILGTFPKGSDISITPQSSLLPRFSLLMKLPLSKTRVNDPDLINKSIYISKQWDPLSW